ncbi:disks large homolog 5-like isoform X2 [Meriones unguiculatus]|uniref:disks large homolog 5-like isoform X2 n=1 Tax=Meriones unguiculatus TaxID=10047 RepID=UPI00293EC284|nr:disks large homolog 5-like isoform X2 [Meriones unguiculatus]
MWARLRRLFGKENVDGRDSKERKKAVGLPSHFKISRKKLSWGRHRASEEPPSSTKLPSKKQVKKEMERLTTQLQLKTRERNELCDHLILVTEGCLDKRPYNRQNPFCERLKIQHKKVTLNLQSLEHEHTEALHNLKDLDRETRFYRNLHSRLQMEQTQLKRKVDMLRQENKEVKEDWALLQHQLVDLQQICEDQEEETCDFQTQELSKCAHACVQPCTEHQLVVSRSGKDWRSPCRTPGSRSSCPSRTEH